MNIKLAGTLVATLAGMSFSAFFTVPVLAQGQTGMTAPNKPASATSKPTNAQQPGAQSGQSNDMEMQGSLKINSPGFKGNIQFDGNPLNLIQIPGITTAAPAKPAGQTDPLQQPVNAAMPTAPNGMPAGMQQGVPMQPGMQMQQPAAMQPIPGGYPTAPNMVPPSGAYPAYPGAQPPMGSYPGYPMPPQQGAPNYPAYPTAAAPPAAGTPGAPAAQTPAAGTTAAAPNMFDPAAVERAARAIGTGVIEALPKAGLPINPALINEGSKMLQTVLSGNALVPPKPGAPTPTATAHPTSGGSSMSTQTVTTFQSGDGSAAATDAPPATLMTLSDILKGAMYNLEMTQEALYLSTFGDPNMRLTSALEAQRNANEARVAADKAAALAPNATGQAGEMITATRNAALRAQTFADQARDAANSGSVVSPQ